MVALEPLDVAEPLLEVVFAVPDEPDEPEPFELAEPVADPVFDAVFDPLLDASDEAEEELSLVLLALDESPVAEAEELAAELVLLLSSRLKSASTPSTALISTAAIVSFNDHAEMVEVRRAIESNCEGRISSVVSYVSTFSMS